MADSPTPAELAQHIANQHITVVQAAFRLLGMRLSFELRNAEGGQSSPVPARCPAECGPECAEGHLYAYRCALKPAPMDPAAILGAGQGAERRDRYAAAVGDTQADAAMAVADAEQNELRHSLQSAGRALEDYTSDNAHLRARITELEQRDPVRTAPDSAPGSSYPYLDTLGTLLSRMVRGALLEAERPLLREHVEHLLADRSRSEHAACRLMEQRQEMAEERYAWQERGRKAEAALTRLDQMATAWVERLPDTISTATAADAVQHTVRATLGPPAAGQVDDSSPTPATVVHPVRSNTNESRS
ncbi:hypothetical protein ACGFWI_01115 [Streptomyces sp. NPDC048434]|uniref:hypothetical protein n=1 Tax=Streptomyces sp. NPDC048434 TaxID=3365549 RepID=UPI003718F2C5